MIEEYIEFFKSKKRIRQEWAQHSQDVQAKVDEYMATLVSYEGKIEALNSVLPILVELTCLASKFTQEDVEVRSKLSQQLRLDKLPNDGYLMKEKAAALKGSSTASQKQLHLSSQKSAETANKSSQSFNKKRPISEQIVLGGSLCVSTFAYRNTELTI